MANAPHNPYQSPSTASPAEPVAFWRRASARTGAGCLLTPVLLLLPYLWWVYIYAEHWIVSPAVTDPLQREFFLGQFTTWTFGPFTLLCVLSGLFWLAWAAVAQRRARRRRMQHPA